MIFGKVLAKLSTFYLLKAGRRNRTCSRGLTFRPVCDDAWDLRGKIEGYVRLRKKNRAEITPKISQSYRRIDEAKTKLFTSSASFGFHGAPLVTFLTGRLDLRELDGRRSNVIDSLA